MRYGPRLYPKIIQGRQALSLVFFLFLRSISFSRLFIAQFTLHSDYRQNIRSLETLLGLIVEDDLAAFWEHRQHARETSPGDVQHEPRYYQSWRAFTDITDEF